VPASGGATVSGMTHEDRSNSMNSSAFSCGDSGPVSQPPGGGELSLVDGSPATCKSLNTARPQYWPGVGGVTGVSKEKYIVCAPEVIHG